MLNFTFWGSGNRKDKTAEAVGNALLSLAAKYPDFTLQMQGHGGTVTLYDGAEMSFASPSMLAYVLLALEEQTAAAEGRNGG